MPRPRPNEDHVNYCFERWLKNTKRLIRRLRTNERKDWHSSSALSQAQFIARELYEFRSRCHVQAVHRYRPDGSFEDFTGATDDVWALWPPGKIIGAGAGGSLVRFLSNCLPSHEENGTVDRASEHRVVGALQALQDGPVAEHGWLEIGVGRIGDTPDSRLLTTEPEPAPHATTPPTDTQLQVIRGRAAVGRWIARTRQRADSLRAFNAPAARRMVAALDHALVLGELRLARVVVAIMCTSDALPATGYLQ